MVAVGAFNPAWARAKPRHTVWAGVERPTSRFAGATTLIASMAGSLPAGWHSAMRMMRPRRETTHRVVSTAPGWTLRLAIARCRSSIVRCNSAIVETRWPALYVFMYAIHRPQCSVLGSAPAHLPHHPLPQVAGEQGECGSSQRGTVGVPRLPADKQMPVRLARPWCETTHRVVPTRARAGLSEPACQRL